MTITLITVCFNSVAVIRTAIESVLRQTWPTIDYLVIDGGSDDGTLDVIREFEAKFHGRMRWQSEKDRGMYDAINKGIRMASGDIVGILNADDVLADDQVIERVAKAFERAGKFPAVKEPGTADTPNLEAQPDDGGAGACRKDDLQVVYGDIRFVADRQGVDLDGLLAEPTARYYSARHWRPWMLQWGFMPPHPSVYIRRDCFEALGVYALDYKIAADYALLVRFLRKARLRCQYVPMCFVDMRLGGMSTRSWRSNLLLNQEIVRGNREAGYFCCLPMLVPKYAFKVFEFVIPKLRRFSFLKHARA